MALPVRSLVAMSRVIAHAGDKHGLSRGREAARHGGQVHAGTVDGDAHALAHGARIGAAWNTSRDQALYAYTMKKRPWI